MTAVPITTPRLLLASDPDEVDRQSEEGLARARELFAEILGEGGPRTLENTLAPYDALRREVAEVSDQGDDLSNLHPEKGMREAGERAHQAAEALQTELALNRDLYEAFAGLDVEGEDEETRYAVFKILRDFRRAGVDRDKATRGRIRELRDAIVAVGQEFERNIREDVRSLRVEPEELDGLPQDFVEAHAPEEDGKVFLTTNYPDLFPVLKYARREDLRCRLYKEYLNRGHPQNLEVLRRLLELRHDLARTLDYPTYADYVTEDKMIGSAGAARAFVDRVADVAGERAQEDYGELLERKRQDDAEAERLEPWDRMYYPEVVRSERHGVDAKAVRAYFPFERVLDGLLTLTSDLFGVRYTRVEDAPVWHSSVHCYDVYEGEERMGRIYLDLHPRKGKFTHAASANIVRGVRETQLPQGLLMCNFPDPRKSKGALMEYSDAETFFHEFGHLLHNIFSGRVRWVENAMDQLEWDFIEVPSQMMEEWVRDPEVLRRFAIHHETGEPIPRELVKKLRAADAVARGLFARRQMSLAALSLGYYTRDPEGLDTTAFAREVHEKYDLLPWFEDTHFQCGFGHLNGYSAIYYTYMWSLAIQKDMFSRFASQDSLLDPAEAVRYRRLVLDPGSSRPANELVEGFLGRAHSFDALETWLNRRPA